MYFRRRKRAWWDSLEELWGKKYFCQKAPIRSRLRCSQGPLRTCGLGKVRYSCSSKLMSFVLILLQSCALCYFLINLLLFKAELCARYFLMLTITCSFFTIVFSCRQDNFDQVFLKMIHQKANKWSERTVRVLLGGNLPNFTKFWIFSVLATSFYLCV